MKSGFITLIQKKVEHTVKAPWLTPSEEILECTISREDDGFTFLG
jgi:hypothetical protein